jgi:hypothetical protein
MRRRRKDPNDLGFPAESDLSAFALSFAAVIRDRDTCAQRRSLRRRPKNADEFGLPAEGDPGDFACAFRAVRDQPQDALVDRAAGLEELAVPDVPSVGSSAGGGSP